MSAAATDTVVCPVCAGTRMSLEFRAVNGYPIVRCSGCRLAFTDARDAPPPSTLYPAFDQSERVSLKATRSALSVFLRQRAAVVRTVKPAGRLLDFGCGAGAFAHWMSQGGYEVVGLEPFSLGPREAFPHLNLIREPLDSAASSLGVFDAITLWQVLEHLDQPVEVLARLTRHLAPDGVMVISVPNYESWQSRLFRGGWFHLDPPRHLLQFEPATLDACLARAGLEVIARRRFLPEYGTSGWVQSALNLVLPHHNFLYEFVKDRGALAGTSAASRMLHLVGSALLAAPIALLSLPIEAVASFGDHAAALTVVARRRPTPSPRS